ncbi:MAG: hypothetical protein AAF961_01675, partial [Planctomycetota bacterium]
MKVLSALSSAEKPVQVSVTRCQRRRSPPALHVPAVGGGGGDAAVTVTEICADCSAPSSSS